MIKQKIPKIILCCYLDADLKQLDCSDRSLEQVPEKKVDHNQINDTRLIPAGIRS